MNQSATSIILPTFNEHELVLCLEELLRLDHEWILREKGYSCYVRATEINTHHSLGVTTPEEAYLYIIMAAVGPFHENGIQPISLYSDEKMVRAYHGGTGNVKIGGNYGPIIGHMATAQEKGHQDILWLLDR